jgi:thiopeptide-type bacteriocin biosynthesis protein
MYEMMPYTNVRTANQTTDKAIFDSWFDKKLFISSSSLYHQLQKNDNFHKATLAKRKYKNRSRYRATPFGLFSSVSFNKMDEKNNTRNQMIIQNDFNVYTSVDSEWISKFISTIKIENLDSLQINWNSNVVYQNSNFIYNNWTSDDNKKFNTNKIHINNLIEAIRDSSKKALSLEELSKKLAERNNILLPSKILLSVVKQLVLGGYLITDLDNLTFIQNFNLLIQYLEEKHYTFPKATITKVRNLISNLNNSISNFNIDTVIELEELLSSIIISQNYLRFDSETKVINLDLNKSAIEKSVLPLINFLSSYAIRVPLSDRYQADVHFFKEKYGNTKVKFLDFYKSYQLVREKNSSLESTTSDLEKKLKTQLLALTSTAAKLNSEWIDVANLSFEDAKIESEIPPTIQTCFYVENNDEKLKLLLTPYAGNNGLGRLEGRFSYLDQEYFTLTKNIERRKFLEANTEVVTVKYMPKNQHYYNIMNDCYVGNLNLQFGTTEDNQSVSLEQLFISIQNNKLTLSALIDGTEKIVKFEQYNVSNIEHFSPHILNDLLFWSHYYYSNIMSLLFDIQKIRKDFIHFPKILFKEIELFPQSWLIKNYMENKLSQDQFFNKFTEMKNIYEIPNSLFVRCNDQKILIDTNHKEDLDILWDIYKTDSSYNIYLEENSLNFSDLVTIDPEGNHYISEFVFNFVSQKIQPKKLIEQPLFHSKEVFNLERKVNWQHFNIYLPYELQDDFLGTFLYELVKELKGIGAINNSFFIRYFDDRHHIRLRFSPTSHINLIDEHLKKGVITGDIIEYSAGKYDPEYERYGGLSVMTEAEDFFCADSTLILSLLGSCLVNEKIDKVDHAIFLVFKLLSIYTRDTNQQFLIMDDGYSNKDFSKNYRENRHKYLAYCDITASSNEDLAANHFVFTKDQLAFWENELSSYYNKLKIEKRFDLNIVRSLIHMTCIRLFGIKSEEEELVGNMVWRVLKQKIAMEKKTNSDNLISN